jgi:hypothetical protein
MKNIIIILSLFTIIYIIYCYFIADLFTNKKVIEGYESLESYEDCFFLDAACHVRNTERGIRNAARVIRNTASAAAEEAGRIAREAVELSERLAREAAIEAERIANLAKDEAERLAREAAVEAERIANEGLQWAKDVGEKAAELGEGVYNDAKGFGDDIFGTVVDLGKCGGEQFLRTARGDILGGMTGMIDCGVSAANSLTAVGCNRIVNPVVNNIMMPILARFLSIPIDILNHIIRLTNSIFNDIMNPFKNLLNDVHEELKKPVDLLNSVLDEIRSALEVLATIKTGNILGIIALMIMPPIQGVWNAIKLMFKLPNFSVQKYLNIMQILLVTFMVGNLYGFYSLYRDFLWL